MDMNNNGVLSLIIITMLFWGLYTICQNQKEHFEDEEKPIKRLCKYDSVPITKIHLPQDMNIGVHIGGHTSSHSNALVASAFKRKNMIN